MIWVNQGDGLALPGLRRVKEGFLKEEIAKKRPEDEPELKVEAERMFPEGDRKYVQKPSGINSLW